MFTLSRGHMKIDFSYDDKNDVYKIIFEAQDFKSPKNFAEALILIDALSGDFSLDPELTEEDLKEICQAAKEQKLKDFSVEISGNGVECFL